MQKLNLCNREKSDIDYSISRFPDGEVQITLEEINRKDFVVVKCRITNAEELFILIQVLDILDRQEVVYNLDILYLMGMRMDRVMDFNRPFTLKIIGDVLHNCKANKIGFTELHSDRIHSLFAQDPRFKNSSRINHHVLFMNQIDNEEALNFVNYQIVFPDEGAYLRYKDILPVGFRYGVSIVCDKVRSIETGKILNVKVKNPAQLDGRPLLIIDDLCDAGGTFLAVADALREHTKVPLAICVIHMVNRRGIENLSKVYDRVYFTNSYKTWDNLPENCTQIEIV